MVKNLPANTGGLSLIPGQGTKSLPAAITEQPKYIKKKKSPSFIEGCLLTSKVEGLLLSTWPRQRRKKRWTVAPL